MGMVVQHNLNALTAYNKLNTNVAGLKKSSEKLASGYRINRAGDDAAGLAISEKMRSQIRGLNQAVRNSQDGINMIQTYEGAAQETQNILQRMKELASESANGTYDNTTDRDAIQLEFDQLNDELNQIADTDFNGRLALNGGTMADGSVAANNKTIAGKPAVATNAVDDPASAVSYKGGVNGFVDWGGNGTINVDGVSITVKGGQFQTVTNGTLTNGTVSVGDTTYSATTAISATGSTLAQGGVIWAGAITATTKLAINEDTSEITIYGQKFNVQWKNDGTISAIVNGTGSAMTTMDTGARITFGGTATGGFSVVVAQTYHLGTGGVVTAGGTTATAPVVGHINLKKGVSVSDAFEHGRRNLTYSDSITLQTGARSKDAVDFTFEYVTSGIGDLNADLDISARGLGTAQLSLVTAEKSNEAIDHIDNAINKVSMVRATFGAMQNRLEHKIDNLTTTSTNLQEAESNIRDTDMASEMMNYTKYNILQQAAQSMLAQANQQPQSILQLLG